MKNPTEELNFLRQNIDEIQQKLIQELLDCLNIYELEEVKYQKMITLLNHYTKNTFRITKAIEAQEIIELVLINGINNKQ